MKPVFIQESNMITPLGYNLDQNFEAVYNKQSGIQPYIIHPNLGTHNIARIDDKSLPTLYQSLPIENNISRIEKLAITALAPLFPEGKKASPHSLLILSTTKGNIQAIANQNITGSYIPSLATNIANLFGFQKDPIVLSNACVSGLMALSLAKRYLQMDLVKEVYVLAVDEISIFVQSGFHSLQALSPDPCRPYDKNRKGLNLGEAAVACRVSTEKKNDSIRIAGDANINDANHISGPSRMGEGLYLSIQNAMKEALIQVKNIDYIVGHGTATIYNDEMESIAFHRIGLSDTPLAGYKAYYGHTLGASGLLETALLAACMRKNYLLPTLNFEHIGTSQRLNVITNGETHPIRTALKTASGFAGTNTALILTKE